MTGPAPAPAPWSGSTWLKGAAVAGGLVACDAWVKVTARVAGCPTTSSLKEALGRAWHVPEGCSDADFFGFARLSPVLREGGPFGVGGSMLGGSVADHSTSATKFKGAGPGLGLTLVKGIVEAHGGKVWVESQGYDEINFPGSKFFVVLPLHAVNEPKEQEEPQKQSQIETVHWRSKELKEQKEKAQKSA